MYGEEDMLWLSGLQHFMFCPRQWALIHMEQCWQENKLTAEGRILHQKVDDPFRRERFSGDVITLRALPLVSKQLGLQGVADAVEIHPLAKAPKTKAELIESKMFTLLPVEYKRGRPKPDERDMVQLVAQAICLEEIFGIPVEKGALFYWEERHRLYVDITKQLRDLTMELSTGMHRYWNERYMPPPEKKSSCKNCSLVNDCLPDIGHKQKASRYLSLNLYEKTT